MKCGTLSFMPSRETGPGAYFSLAPWLSPFFAMAIYAVCESLWLSLLIPIAGIACLFVAHEFILFHRPLVATSVDEVAAARKRTASFALFWLILAVAVILLALIK
jgi:hypothetical protein